MILVTGATGLVGMHLMVRLLENSTQGAVNICALYRNEVSIEKVKSFLKIENKLDLLDKIIWLEADILDVPQLELAFKSITKVYHCAALVSFEGQDEELLRKTNIEGTANIVNLCLDFGIHKLCYVSSIAALGDLLPHQTIVNEKTEWNHDLYHSDYAISKHGAEMEVWRGRQEGLNVIIINPGIIIGAMGKREDWNNGSGKIFLAVQKGISFYTNGVTGFVSVTDVVNAMVLLMESKIVNEQYILVAENLTYKHFISKIAADFGLNPPKYYAPRWMTEIVWRTDWLVSKVLSNPRKLTKSIAKSLHSIDIYDNSKIKKEINIEFEEINIAIYNVAQAFKTR